MMEVGQIIHNNPVGLECPSYVAALISKLRVGIGRIYWNVNQKIWPGDPEFSWLSLDEKRRSEYPEIDPEQINVPGMEWHDYYNWGGSPEDDGWDQAKAERPNFSFEGVEIRWYKRFGRSMSVNVAWTPEQWVRWYDRCEQTLSAFESHGPHYPRNNKIDYPDVTGKVSLEPNDAALYHLKLLEKIHLLEARENVIACEIIRALEGGARRSYDPEPLKSSDYRYTQTLNWLQQLTGAIPKEPHWTEKPREFWIK